MATTASFFVFMMVGVPIAIVLLLSAIVFAFATNSPALMNSYLQQLYGGIDSYGLMAFPLFLLVGEIMNKGGVTQRLLDMSAACLGPVKGGLAYINVIANAILSAILGSASAQIAIMGRMIIPEMVRRGYDKPFAAALTAVAGLLGPIIPPSLMFVVYSVMTQVSIGDMLIAGILPGILLAAALMGVIWVIGFVRDLPREPRLRWRERGRALVSGLPALAIPLVMIGGIMSGLATPTESAALAVIAAYLAGRYYGHKLAWADLRLMLLNTGLNTGLILFLVAAANVFTWVLIYGNVPQTVSSWIEGVATGPISFMLLVMVVLLVIGTVIDGVPGLIMVVPILFPIATQVYHIDPVHFGVVVCINLVLGLVSPPVGIALFVAAQAAEMKPGDIFMAALPFCLATCAVLVILCLFPWFSLALIR
ncbi:TRAP transporter large permease [Reyranella sp. CPCC 100927]|uniref:TRAP transporter large permease n=1 Tax=Reyranella sp. CPCC 100927 TaxID=2599616 RepID=UPI0011B52753|nr:TRAP transporter large permease [Reyranella sp. CPCC 100927]TWS99609.1 TRAP transporter large permease [Reyranella sp. CPCC 100927]